MQVGVSYSISSFLVTIQNLPLKWHWEPLEEGQSDLTRTFTPMVKYVFHFWERGMDYKENSGMKPLHYFKLVLCTS